METIFTVTGKSGSENISTYSMRDIRRIAKAAVGKQGKLYAITVNFNEMNGTTRVIANYETSPNQQTFTTVAI